MSNVRMHWVALIVLVLASTAARAQLTIEITRGQENAVPIAIVPFGWEVERVRRRSMSPKSLQRICSRTVASRRSIARR